jgi:hypothetical protein
MAHFTNYDNCKTLLTIFQNSTEELIRNVCVACGKTELQEEMVTKFMDTGVLKILKKKKDPNAPSSAKTSYLLYANDVRDDIRKKHPDIPISEVTKIIGLQWNELSTDDKQKYVELASADKERFQQEHHEYEQNLFKMSAAFSGAGSMHAQAHNSVQSLTDVE